MKTLDGVTVATVLSLLARDTVVPPNGAGSARLTDKEIDWFGATCMLAGTTIGPNRPTLMFAVPLEDPGADAVIWACPAATPVTVNEPVVEPALMFTTGG